MRGCDSRTPLSKGKAINCLYLATDGVVGTVDRPLDGSQFSYDHGFLTQGH